MEQRNYMYMQEFKDALNDYISSLDEAEIKSQLYDYIFDWMNENMSHTEISTFMETGEW